MGVLRRRVQGAGPRQRRRDRRRRRPGQPPVDHGVVRLRPALRVRHRRRRGSAPRRTSRGWSGLSNMCAGTSSPVSSSRESETSVLFLIETLAGEPVGACSLDGITPRARTAELGIWIAEEHWNEGLGTDAVRTLCRFGFREMNLQPDRTARLRLQRARGRRVRERRVPGGGTAPRRPVRGWPARRRLRDGAAREELIEADVAAGRLRWEAARPHPPLVGKSARGAGAGFRPPAAGGEIPLPASPVSVAHRPQRHGGDDRCHALHPLAARSASLRRSYPPSRLGLSRTAGPSRRSGIHSFPLGSMGPPPPLCISSSCPRGHGMREGPSGSVTRVTEARCSRSPRETG